MVIQLIVPAQVFPAPESTPGKHRLHRGSTGPGGQIVGKTPAQFEAVQVIRRLGWDLEPRTRRAR